MRLLLSMLLLTTTRQVVETVIPMKIRFYPDCGKSEHFWFKICFDSAWMNLNVFQSLFGSIRVEPDPSLTCYILFK